MANYFVDLDRPHTNFSKLASALEREGEIFQPVVKFLRDWEEAAVYISELRNYFEHPRDIRTVVHNFQLLEDCIRTPQWHLEGKVTTEARPIKEEASKIVILLTDFAEAMFFLFLLARLDRGYPYALERSPPNDSVATRFFLMLKVARTEN